MRTRREHLAVFQLDFFQISLGRVTWKETLEDPPLNGIVKALSIVMSAYR